MSIVFREMPIGDLPQCAVGYRVIVLHDGGTIQGTLTSAWTLWEKYAKPEPGPRCRIEVQEGNALVKIADLPMDFRIQIGSEVDDV